MAVALSRVRHLPGLHGIHSAGAPELFPKTPTLTFYKSSYSSRYLVFTPVETTAENRSTRPAEADGRAAGAAGQVRRAALRLPGERGRDPVHRLSATST